MFCTGGCEDRQLVFSRFSVEKLLSPEAIGTQLCISIPKKPTTKA